MSNSFIQKCRPTDVIGLVVIGGGFILLSLGIDHVVGGAVIAVVTYYFVSTKKNVDAEHSQVDKRDGGV